MDNKVDKCFVNGCFDILHIGHIRLFEFCKERANSLVIAVDSDERVRAVKGSLRPFNGICDRMEMLYSIKYIDKVLMFKSDAELSEIILRESPDIMVVGSDWRGREIIGAGGAKEVVFFERINGYSTTDTLGGLG